MSNQKPSVAARIAATIKKLTHTEKLALTVCLAIFLLGLAGFVLLTNNESLVERPAAGGRLVEGVVGAPRFINPLLATANPDRDLVALVYSGLMRRGADGKLVPDLAREYSVSDDGKTYTFTLRPDLVWHDGAPVTAKDVVFTVNLAKEPAIKSPRRASWEGVQVSAQGDDKVIFELKQPYGSFLENATLGLLPAHLWQEVSNEAAPFSNLNIEPVGTGPYQFKQLTRDRDGLITNYTLAAASHFALGEPKIKNIIFNFYPSEEGLVQAFKKGEITNLGAVSPALAEVLIKEFGSSIALYQAPLPRLFGVFFNQNQAKIFAQAEVRQALDLLIDRPKLVQTVLAGFGRPASGPIPPQTKEADLANLAATVALEVTASSTATSTTSTPLLEAETLLKKKGWTRNAETNVWEQVDKKETKVLAFSLSTADTPELKAAAELVKQTWEDFGAKVEIKVFEAGALNQNVIRPREYDALLFGEIVGRDPDLYSFWHSSQRLDPGLNIALYTNASVDKMLEELKASLPNQDREEAYAKIAAEIVKDTPVVFLYTPDFIYLLPSELKGVAIEGLGNPAERFMNVHDWYLKTEKVWPIFNQS
ncbi:MAG: ABC transporter substrate-binding protein [Patescibacteria group bacterium]